MHVQYLVDEKGKKTGVQLSLKQWDEIQEGIKKLELFNELKQAFKEMEQHKKSLIKTPTTRRLF